MTTTFEDVKVGDRVYSLRFGWGSVSSFCYDADIDTFYVNFDNVSVGNYLRTGFIYGLLDLNRDLYWDIPEIIAPEKPKKMIKVKRYFNFDKTEQYKIPYMTGSVDGYDSLEVALRNSNKKNYFCTKEFEFEIEE